MTLAIDRDLSRTVESAFIAQVILIVEPQRFSFVLIVATCMRGRTGDLRLARRSTWLSCFTVVRRQVSKGLPVSSTFVMVEEWCRFVVVVFVFALGQNSEIRECACPASDSLTEMGLAVS